MRKRYILEQLPLTEERDVTFLSSLAEFVASEDRDDVAEMVKGMNSVMRALEGQKGKAAVAKVLVASKVSAVLRQSVVAVARSQGVPVFLLEASSAELGAMLGMRSCVCVGVLVV